MLLKKTVFVVCTLITTAAACLSAESGTYSRGKLLSAWDFTKAEEYKIPNEVKGLQYIKLNRKETPVKVKDGLQFNNGMSAWLPLFPGKIAGFFDGKEPFEIAIKIKPLMPSPGGMGALLDDPSVLSFGVLKHMLIIATFVNQAKDHFTLFSKNKNLRLVLVPGTVYELQLKLLSDSTELWIDGKLISSVNRSGLRKLDKKATFKIGKGWGHELFYNGIISYIRIYSLTLPKGITGASK